MADIDKTYWRTFNVLCRLCGLMALLVGAVGLALGSLGLGIFCLALGVALTTVRAYRPDLGDVERVLAPKEFSGRSIAPRHWWTGDRKPEGHPDV